MRAQYKSGPAVTLARGLGWFSIGLGVAELLAPRAMSRATGLERREGLLAGYGLREIATGVGILASDDPTPWIWGRVGGDVLDMGTLASGLARPEAERNRTLAGLVAVAGVTVLDVICGRALSAERSRSQRRGPLRDYSSRTGWPSGVDQIRGAARKDFEVPKDMRTPEALRPFNAASA